MSLNEVKLCFYTIRLLFNIYYMSSVNDVNDCANDVTRYMQLTRTITGKGNKSLKQWVHMRQVQRTGIMDEIRQIRNGYTNSHNGYFPNYSN